MHHIYSAKLEEPGVPESYHTGPNSSFSEALMLPAVKRSTKPLIRTVTCS